LLLRQGAPADEVLVLVAGECDVLASPDGGPEALINRVTGPDLLGEIGVLHERPRTASVRAASSCTVRRLPGDAFLAAVTPASAPAALTAAVEQRLIRWAG
jgi:CRP-like cAMP-binding protein